MQQQQKAEIIQAAKEYMVAKGLNASEMARLAKINGAYFNIMNNGGTTTQAGDKTVEIADKYFVKLAETIGFSIKKAYWKTVPTIQFAEVIAALEAAKEEGTSGMLICDTGSGKTYALDLFVNRHPRHTYRVTVSKLDTLPSILERLLEIMHLNEKGRSANKMHRVINQLQWLHRQGEKVCIIIDEAENLRTPVFGLVKAMYDGIVNYASIMLIGTTELTDKMERLKRKNKDGMPQFCRRFKAGTHYISAIEPASHFPVFFREMGIAEEKGLCDLLTRQCENYGELHDYLEPALREADRRGVPLTEQLFRIKYNMPK